MNTSTYKVCFGKSQDVRFSTLQVKEQRRKQTPVNITEISNYNYKWVNLKLFILTTISLNLFFTIIILKLTKDVKQEYTGKPCFCSLHCVPIANRTEKGGRGGLQNTGKCPRCPGKTVSRTVASKQNWIHSTWRSFKDACWVSVGNY